MLEEPPVAGRAARPQHAPRAQRRPPFLDSSLLRSRLPAPRQPRSALDARRSTRVIARVACREAARAWQRARLRADYGCDVDDFAFRWSARVNVNAALRRVHVDPHVNSRHEQSQTMMLAAELPAASPGFGSAPPLAVLLGAGDKTHLSQIAREIGPASGGRRAPAGTQLRGRRLGDRYGEKGGQYRQYGGFARHTPNLTGGGHAHVPAGSVVVAPLPCGHATLCRSCSVPSRISSLGHAFAFSFRRAHHRTACVGGRNWRY